MLLRKLIQSRGLKYKCIAKKMGLSAYGLQRKIDNKSEFKTSEVALLCNIIGGLSYEQQREIFFANGVDLKSPLCCENDEAS